MSDFDQDLETLWGRLLSQEPEQIRSAYQQLSAGERQTVRDHLKDMSESSGWLPAQRTSARIALAEIGELTTMTNSAIRRVTVFGGSTPSAQAYQEALQLGALLGRQGYTVLTGGYIGTMEAVSRGASEAGAHVVGVTCDEIENWRRVKPNAWVKEERRFPTMRQRLFALIESCDAALALPGGIGTLTEISLMWNLLLTEAIQPRPLVIIGEGWKALFDSFLEEFSEYVPPSQRRWAAFAHDNAAAVARLRNPEPL